MYVTFAISACSLVPRPHPQGRERTRCTPTALGNAKLPGRDEATSHTALSLGTVGVQRKGCPTIIPHMHKVFTRPLPLCGWGLGTR